MFRRLPLPLRLTAVAALLLLPTLTYETLQKGSELVGPRSAMLRLSQRAEEETRWRPRTGVGPLDHTLHELAETRRFYRLTGRYLRRLVT